LPVRRDPLISTAFFEYCLRKSAAYRIGFHGLPLPKGSSTHFMDTEDNKGLVRRWLRLGEGGFSGDFNDYFAPEYQGHLSGGQPQSLDDLMALERGFAAAFSNMSYDVQDLLAIDDKVVLRVKTSATHTGEFHGVQPTGPSHAYWNRDLQDHSGADRENPRGELDLMGLFGQLRSA
jgi:predicted ester cyclase